MILSLLLLIMEMLEVKLICLSVYVNSVQNGHLWDLNLVLVLVRCPSVIESQIKGVKKGNGQL